MKPLFGITNEKRSRVNGVSNGRFHIDAMCEQKAQNIKLYGARKREVWG